jgi:hypothetical protein
MDATRRSARSISAFCEGGRAGEEGKIVLRTSFPDARVKRMGKIVKVYKNESKQRINPNIVI